MRKIILVPICIFIFFLAEFFLFNMAGPLFMPNLLLLAIIYFNLAFGVRYSLYAAILAGVIKDSFGADIFGIYTFSFVVCAYMTTILKKYLHYVASRRSRLLLVFFIILINIVIHFVLRALFAEIDFLSAVKFVCVPQILITLLVTPFIFTELKRCVSKLFV